jgi:hypothetical protein
MMATQIPERPGSFREFVSIASGAGGVAVTEFKYRYSAGASANILWSAGVTDKAAASALVSRLNEAGLATLDISAIDAAQVHLRHLVGGRARSYMGEIPFERVFQVQFPERAGALRHFLEVLSPSWNVTLFHYRQTGNSTSYVLLGIQVRRAARGGGGRGGECRDWCLPQKLHNGKTCQRFLPHAPLSAARAHRPHTSPQVPPEAEADFKRAQRQLRQEFTFEEIEGQAREVFNMFIQ